MIVSQIAKFFPNHTPIYDIDDKDYDFIMMSFVNDELCFFNRSEYFLYNIDILINISNIDKLSDIEYGVVLVVSDDYIEYKQKIYGVILNNDDYIQFTKERPKRWSRTEYCVMDINNDLFIYGDDIDYYMPPPHICYYEKIEDNVYESRINKNHKDYKEMYDYTNEEWIEKNFVYTNIDSDMRDYSNYKKDISTLFND